MSCVAVVSAKFIGLQCGMRLYNVTGNHPLKGSTVSVKTLVEEGIEVPDLTPDQISTEYRKITEFLDDPKALTF